MTTPRNTRRTLIRASAFLLAGFPALSGCSSPGQTSAAQQQLVVDHATLAVQDLFAGTNAQSRSQKLLSQAKAVMVCPSVFNLSIGLGGSGGRCVLLSRDARGSWSDPAFYRLSSGSLGLQLGVQDAEIMFFIMSQRGIQALLDSQFKFDASAAASFASIGTGAGDGTGGASNTDIYAAEKASGLYAGVSLGGSKLTVDSGANRSYYNQTVGPEDIVVTMRVNNPAADPLRRVLGSVAQIPTAPSGADSIGQVKNAATQRAGQAVNQAAGQAGDEVGNNPYANFPTRKETVTSQPLGKSGY